MQNMMDHVMKEYCLKFLRVRSSDLKNFLLQFLSFMVVLP